MNNQEDYKSKYIKYKTKYLNLLNQSGGDCSNRTSDTEKIYCEFEEKIKKEFEEIEKERLLIYKMNECNYSKCRKLFYCISRYEKIAKEIDEFDKKHEIGERSLLNAKRLNAKYFSGELKEFQKKCKCATFI